MKGFSANSLVSFFGIVYALLRSIPLIQIKRSYFAFLSPISATPPAKRMVLILEIDFAYLLVQRFQGNTVIIIVLSV
jgi:hypothetical protein